MKKILALVLALVMVLGVAATVSAGGQSGRASGKPRVAFIVKGYQDTYCYLVGQIFERYAKEKYGSAYDVKMFDGEVNADTLNNLISTCTADKFNVIILQQHDPSAPVPYAKAAMDAGIGFITTVGKINDNGASLYIDADPVQQGTLPAQYLVDQGYMKAGTNVVILKGPDAQFHSDGRTEGFMNVIKKSGAKLVDIQTANWRTSEAQPIVENWLVSNPEIEVIMACNDDMALGAITACENAGRKDIKIIGVDANELGCIALKQGKLTATVAQDTEGYAYLAADYAAQIIQGQKPKSVALDSVLILNDKVDGILRTIHRYSDAKIQAIK
jgi:ABC-type sugar transport system substrate-binding protein